MAASLLDDPSKPEFAEWDGYQTFATRVRLDRRFATDRASRDFIATVLATVPARDMNLTEGQILYRAQIGVDYGHTVVNGEEVGIEPRGFSSERMKPIPAKATVGRANPAGIAFLYLASAVKTAISEVRPWIGSTLSVAQFRMLRNMRIVNLTLGHGQFGFGLLTLDQLEGAAPVDSETKRRAVWTDIDNAFSRPVTRSEDVIEYVPTQILAEAFRDHGYDGVVYRSNFGDPGYNVALFDLDSAEAINCTPYEIEQIDIKFKEVGNPWVKESQVTVVG